MATPFLFKLGAHLYRSDSAGIGFNKAMMEFVFADAQASTTTVVTLSAELLIGAWYIDGLPMPYVADFELPQHWALCFFLALIAEMIAPVLVKGVVGWASNKINKLLS